MVDFVCFYVVVITRLEVVLYWLLKDEQVGWLILLSVKVTI